MSTLKCFQTGFKLAAFTVFSQTILILNVSKWKPVSKPNLNRLFIEYFEKNRLSQWEKIYFKEKNSTKFIFKQISNTVFSVFLKIDTRSHGVDKQNGIGMQIQSAKRNKKTSSRHSPFYKGTILIVEPSRAEVFKDFY